MATWILGDIHGCASELAALLERIAPGPDDTIVSCGDLVHRGPDPAGVCDLLAAHGARFVLGNHELRVLERVGIAPRRHDGADRGPSDLELPELDAEDLAGDGGTPCRAEPGRRTDVVRYLQTHSGYLLRHSDVDGAGPTPDGRGWLVVHAGFEPRHAPELQPVTRLCTIRRLPGRRRPWWYERYDGPDLVLFGHTHSAVPRIQTSRGRTVAIGLDTGCVYGGALTAYSPELDAFEHVQADAATARALLRSA
ncbi:MAG: metallophosphoesterase [Planctomycetota bacterium]